MFLHLLFANLATLDSVSAAEWRWEIFSLGVAFILLSIGLAALAVFVLRRLTAGQLPLYFGVFVILYAARMILREAALLTIFSIPASVANHSIRIITFTIALPALFLFIQVVEKRWKILFEWVLGVHVTFSVLAISCEVLGYAPRAVDRANSILVLAFWLVLMVYLFSPRGRASIPRELLVVRVGLAIFGILVIHANLHALRLVPGREIEPLGFLAFVCSLGYLVAHRIFAKEESLK